VSQQRARAQSPIPAKRRCVRGSWFLLDFMPKPEASLEAWPVRGLALDMVARRRAKRGGGVSRHDRWPSGGGESLGTIAGFAFSSPFVSVCRQGAISSASDPERWPCTLHLTLGADSASRGEGSCHSFERFFLESRPVVNGWCCLARRGLRATVSSSALPLFRRRRRLQPTTNSPPPPPGAGASLRPPRLAGHRDDGRGSFGATSGWR